MRYGSTFHIRNLFRVYIVSKWRLLVWLKMSSDISRDSGKDNMSINSSEEPAASRLASTGEDPKREGNNNNIYLLLQYEYR